ncbi:MAG: DUF58 domain-containing protein [Marinobacter sp.]|uniref:DUF58 domain-containing protein n=1 Tax=Marinobacter sp. TaxID=50741 RepID=UPI00299E3530|nr:DUF58 domain-containing protein [Marinobacter sp.]MDX1754937.1 DUF58 domain-containing protein [Marinobacter sp.]
MPLQSISQRWQQWVNRRIPRTDAQQFQQRNIFILPTGMGLIFGALLVVMLLTGINYQNSLVYLLTFVLGVVFVAAMHQTHSNLAGLKLTLVQAGEGHVGDRIPFVFRGAADDSDAIAVKLMLGDSTVTRHHVMAHETTDMVLMAEGQRRGYLLPDRIRVETRFPFGLLKAWSWLRPASAAIVYPRPITPPDWSRMTADDGEASESAAKIAGQDQAELRPWRPGDLSQRVQWKRFARSGEMVIADWEGEQGHPGWLDFEAFPGVDVEMRLSYLTAQVLERAKSTEAFGLRLPSTTIEPDSGVAHTAACLRALAVHGLTAPVGQSPESTP